MLEDWKRTGRVPGGEVGTTGANTSTRGRSNTLGGGGANAAGGGPGGGGGILAPSSPGQGMELLQQFARERMDSILSMLNKLNKTNQINIYNTLCFPIIEPLTHTLLFPNAVFRIHHIPVPIP